MSALKSKLAVAALSLSLAGAAFIRFEEGSKQEAYLDPVGIPTICVGSTSGVFLGQKATQRECDERLQEDTTYAGAAIKRCLTGDVRLTQKQYDALVSFTFNVGGGAFCKSTLARKINAGDCLGAANEFQRWNRAGGRVLPGLTSRRAKEAWLYRNGCE